MRNRSRAGALKVTVSPCLHCQAEAASLSSFCVACANAFASLSASRCSSVSDLWPSSLQYRDRATRKKACTELAHLLSPSLGDLHEKNDALKKQVKALQIQLKRREAGMRSMKTKKIPTRKTKKTKRMLKKH